MRNRINELRQRLAERDEALVMLRRQIKQMAPNDASVRQAILYRLSLIEQLGSEVQDDLAALDQEGE